jgi:exodeoxyribonuclease VII small subunit
LLTGRTQAGSTPRCKDAGIETHYINDISRRLGVSESGEIRNNIEYSNQDRYFTGTMTKKPASSFEKNLNALEKVVEQLESGELSLEESLAQFERGIVLARECQRALQEAEQKVQILTQKTPTATPQPFVPDNGGENE